MADEGILLRRGFLYIQKKELENFIRLCAKKELPTDLEGLNNFNMDYKVYKYLVEKGKLWEKDY